MDKVDECCRSVCGSKRHNCVCPFDGIRTLKGKLFLTVQGNSELVIPHRGIKEPIELSQLELLIDCQIVPWDRVGNYSGNGVEGNITDAEPPYELGDVLYVLLMGLCSQKSLEQLTAMKNLLDVSYFLQGSNALTHNRNLLWPIEDLLDGDGRRVSSVDNTFIVFHWDIDVLLVKH
jgi:hypothetical protein